MLQIPLAVAAYALLALTEPVAVALALWAETIIVPPPAGRLFPVVDPVPPEDGFLAAGVTGLLPDAWQN